MSEVSVETLEIENLNLRAELQRVRQVASDRLVFIRVLENFVNIISGAERSLRSDLNEISKQVTERNNAASIPPTDDVGEEE